MKKQILLASAMIAACSVAAQEVVEEVIVDTPVAPGTALTSSFRSNWFISVGAGPQVFFGDHDQQRKFSERISPALDVAVGKWITPSIGFRLMYSGLYAKGATQRVGTMPNISDGPFSTGEEIPGKGGNGYWLTKSKFNFMNLHFDVMFDLCNMIGGYNPARVYSFTPYIGVGYARTWDRPHKNAITGNVGISNIFHISRAFDINLDVRGTGFTDDFDGQEGGRVFDANLSVTAGLTYRFGPRGWKTARTVVTVYDNESVNDLRRQVAELIAKNEQLERDARAGKDVVRTVVENVSGDYLIYFPINVSSLSKADRAQLEMCSKAIKESDKSVKFNIIGYADKATGNPEINEALSRARAESVRECLVNEFGIPASRLDVAWKGGVGNMFYNDPALSRVVIVTSKAGK